MTANFENRLALNPALIVGLGGTGKKTIINFKETFLKSPQIKEAFAKYDKGEPHLPDFIDMLCIDTDVFDENKPEETEHHIRLSEEEYHRIAISNTGQIADNLDSDTYSYLYEWFPRSLRHHVGQISQGAHQFRFTGRFGLFVDIQPIFQKLKSKISKIIARSNVNQDDIIVPLTDVQGRIATPEFYVVGSMCGGSGAGMFLDVAYLLKMAYYQLSGGKGSPHITAIQLTPEAFTQIAIDPNINSTGRIEANGYASLAEVFYFMSKEKFPPAKSAKEVIAQDRRNKFIVNYGPLGKTSDQTTFGSIADELPFDNCYLLGTSNMDDAPTYYAIASDFIYTKLATPLRKAQNSMLDNASQILGQLSSDLEGKQLKCFSSAGFKSFYYPVDVVQDLYTNKLAMDLTYWLKTSKDKIVINAMVDEFCRSNPTVLDFDPDAMMIRLKNLVTRKEYWDNPRYHTKFFSGAQKEGESTADYILRFISENASKKVKTAEIRNRSQVRLEEDAIALREHIKKKVIEIINDPDLGAQVASDFLDNFDKFIKRYASDEMQRKKNEIRMLQTRERMEYTKLATELNDKLTGVSGTFYQVISVFSSSALEKQKAELIEKQKKVTDLEYDLFIADSVDDFLKILGVETQELKKQVEVIVYKLGQISKAGFIERQYYKYLDALMPYSPVQNFIRTCIFEERDVEPFYKYILGEMSNNDIEADFLLQIKLHEEWDKYTNPHADALQNDIIAYCEKIVKDRIFDNIEEFVHWKDSYRRGYKQSLFTSLMNQSAPLITINDRGNNQPQRMNIITLGIAEENSTLAEEIKQEMRKSGVGLTVAPTMNRYEISLLQTLHGIAPYNISSIAQWQKKYRDNNSKINCHAIMANDAYPVLWASYGLIPPKKLEEYYMIYLLLRYDIIVDQERGLHGIEYNNELVQYELHYQQDRPLPIGRTLLEMFEYLKNTTMGTYLIQTVFKDYWQSKPFPEQHELVKTYLPLMKGKVESLEERIEKEIKQSREVSYEHDELLSIFRGIYGILKDYDENFTKIVNMRPKATN
ncbi:MAG: hypothetical protein GX221_05605 [Candidatus Riflebacteria bacterium]|nr:hypothetical protein [Candidatus Riflebacteria bacterium]